jgi:hypothetical protein
MRTLTNDYRDCELLNLGFNQNGRGPYFIRQDGVPPGSLNSQEDRFLLRRDGTWVVNFAVFVMAEEEQRQFIYENVAEVFDTLDKLVGKPMAESQMPEGKSRAELLAALDTTTNRIWARVREVHGSSITR